MSKRQIIVIGLVACATIILVAGLAWALFPKHPKPIEPVATPTQSASPTPAAAASGFTAPPGDNSQEGYDQRQVEVKQNPILSKLPHSTAYWTLSWGGSQEGKYVLVAHIFYARGQDPQQKINEQRPYIENFVNSTGQRPGTYRIDYQSTQF